MSKDKNKKVTKEKVTKDDISKAALNILKVGLERIELIAKEWKYESLLRRRKEDLNGQLKERAIIADMHNKIIMSDSLDYDLEAIKKELREIGVGSKDVPKLSEYDIMILEMALKYSYKNIN